MLKVGPKFFSAVTSSSVKQALMCYLSLVQMEKPLIDSSVGQVSVSGGIRV